MTLDGSVTLDSSGGETGNFILSSSGGANFYGGGHQFEVMGDFSLSDSIYNAGNGLLIVSGDFSHTAGTFTANSGTVMLGGAVAPSDRTSLDKTSHVKSYHH